MRMIFRWRPDDVAACLGISVLWVGLMAVMGFSSLRSFNGWSGLIWSPTIWLIGVCAAAASVRQARRRRAAERAIGATTPRTIVGLSLRAYVHDALVLAILPTLAATAVVFAVGLGMVEGGRLEWGYVAVAALSCLTGVLVGEVTALVIPHSIVAPVLAFAVAVYLSLYGLYGVREVDTWNAFDSFVFVVLGVTTALLLGAALVGAGRVPRTSDRVLPAAAIVAVMVGVFAIGPVQLSGGTREAAESDARCESAGSDTLCLWPQDEFKRPTLTAQLRRLATVRDIAGVDDSPHVYAEPGLIVQGADNVRLVQAIGGEKNSWVSAHFFAWQFIGDGTAHCDAAENFLVNDLLANTVYGDLSYDGFRSNDPESDRIRAELVESLGDVSDQEALEWMGGLLGHYLQTCSLDDVELTSL